MFSPQGSPPDNATFDTTLQTLDLQGFSFEERQGLLPSLTSAFTSAGGWVLERKSTSASTVEFRLEIQLSAIVELYGSIIGCGIELTRNTHAALTALCTRQHNEYATPAIGQVLTLRLELSFLEDVTLHSLLISGSPIA